MNEKDFDMGKRIFETVLKNSELSRDELIKDIKNNYPADGVYCAKCYVGDHKNCKYNKDHRVKCNCRKCRIPKKWS